MLGSSAVNFTNKEMCKYRLEKIKKQDLPGLENSACHEKIAQELNKYLDGLLDKLESRLGNKPQRALSTFNKTLRLNFQNGKG